jgi:hypothetical protein
MSEASSLNLKSRIEFLIELQEFCLNYDHAVRRVPYGNYLYKYTGEQRLPRRASTFIYAFFVFNSLYSINWKKSLQTLDIEDFDVNDDPAERLTEQYRFWKMIDVCYSATGDATPSKYSDNLRRFSERLGVNKPLHKLRGIRGTDALDVNLSAQFNARKNRGAEISLQSVTDFIDSFKALWQHGKQVSLERNLHKTYVNNVLYFVYLVRCNVFHGRKGVAVASLEQSQDKRLLIYSAALLASNQLILDHASQSLGLVKLIGNRYGQE